MSYKKRRHLSVSFKCTAPYGADLVSVFFEQHAVLHSKRESERCASFHGVQKAMEVRYKFDDLDRNGDGLLSQEEVGAVWPSKSGPSTMAPYFLQRVFEVHVAAVSPIDKQPAMSLEEFVDFLLAWEHCGQPASSRHAPVPLCSAACTLCVQAHPMK